MSDELRPAPPLEPEPEQAERIEQTAPVFPWALRLQLSANFFQRLPGGGMELVFCPVSQTPSGWAPGSPGVVVVFGAEEWDRFKREVASDGTKPRIETVKALPDGVRR